jgi:hypothetical protein
MNILAATVNLPLIDKEKVLAETSCIEERFWFYDSYRHTSMLPVMTMGGEMGEKGASNFREKKSFQWTPYAPQTLVDWFEDVVFPWMGMKTRISILKTSPGQRNHEHIDCSPQAFGSRQHKFRIVLKGRTDSLYFVTKFSPLRMFNCDTPFIMDGSWPHGMHNFTGEEKYTVAVGAPWTGLEKYSNIGPHIILRNPSLLPEDLKRYYDQRYFKQG